VTNTHAQCGTFEGVQVCGTNAFERYSTLATTVSKRTRAETASCAATCAREDPIKTCSRYDAVRDYERCCTTYLAKHNQQECRVAARQVKTDLGYFRDDQGNTCQALHKNLRNDRARYSWCKKYGGWVNPEFDLNANEACPGLCDIPTLRRFVPSRK